MTSPITREVIADGASALDGERVSDNTLNENARIIAEAVDRTEISESLRNAILKGGVEDPDSPFFCAYTDKKETELQEEMMKEIKEIAWFRANTMNETRQVFKDFNFLEPGDLQTFLDSSDFKSVLFNDYMKGYCNPFRYQDITAFRFGVKKSHGLDYRLYKLTSEQIERWGIYFLYFE